MILDDVECSILEVLEKRNWSGFLFIVEVLNLMIENIDWLV